MTIPSHRKLKAAAARRGDGLTLAQRGHRYRLEHLKNRHGDHVACDSCGVCHVCHKQMGGAFVRAVDGGVSK